MKNICFLFAVALLILPRGGPLVAQSVVFSGEKAENFDLYLLDPGSMKTTPLTNLKSKESQPTVSPDGKQVAFISDKDGADSIYLLDLTAPTKEWINISAGMGAYAHPCFSPDGKTIAVNYAPDPENVMEDTRLVIIDPANKKQTTILESKKFKPISEDGPMIVLDRPRWIASDSLVFVEIEYSGKEAPRVTASTIHRIDLSTQKSVRLAGGESYYNGTGQAKGYMASIPYFNKDSSMINSTITFAAIEGKIDRTPMSMTPEGKEKKVVALNDTNFFGPVLMLDNGYLYVYRSNDDKLRMAFLPNGKNAKKREIQFDGQAMDPFLVPIP